MMTAYCANEGVAAPSVRMLGEKNGHSGSECVREQRGREGQYHYACPIEGVIERTRMKTKWMKNGILMVAMAGIMLLDTSCGTLLHPERKGQVSGRIDPGIAVLDGIGLLFFIVPGVIAFAVDFTNGTIYLPPGEASLQNVPDDLADMVAVRVDKRELTKSHIERLVREHTGRDIDLSSPNVVVTRIDGVGDDPTSSDYVGL